MSYSLNLLNLPSVMFPFPSTNTKNNGRKMNRENILRHNNSLCVLTSRSRGVVYIFATTLGSHTADLEIRNMTPSDFSVDKLVVGNFHNFWRNKSAFLSLYCANLVVRAATGSLCVVKIGDISNSSRVQMSVVFF